jgi:hypothetical protein
MTDEFLDQLLCLWHDHTRGGIVRGESTRALVVGDYRGTAAQYESQIEAADLAHDRLRSRVVSVEVERMDEPYRAAIYQNARNLYTGRSVWNSPRLPRDPLTREIVVEMARAELKRRLIAAGVT